jgi:hypothetical protein
VAAPAYGTSGAWGSTGTTTLNLAVPASVASGDIIVAAFFTVTGPAGFAHAPNSPRTVNAGGGGNHSVNVLWKRASAADSGTYAFTLSAGGYAEGQAHRFTSCIASGNPWDGNTASTGDGGATNSTTTPAVSFTTTGPDELFFSAGTNWSGGAWTPPTGFTEITDNAADLTADYKVQASAGSSGTVQATCAGNDKVGAWLGALIGTTTAAGSLPSPVTPSTVSRPVSGSSLVLSSQAVSRDSQPPALVNWAPRSRPQPAGSALILSSVSPSRDAQPGPTLALAGIRRVVLGDALVLASRAAPPAPTDSPPEPVVVGGVRLSGAGTALVLSSWAVSADSQPQPVVSVATRGPTLGAAMVLSSRGDPVATTDVPGRPLVISPLRPTGPGSTLILAPAAPSLDVQPAALVNAAGAAPVRRGSAMVLGSAADPLPPTLPVTVVAPGGLYLPRSGVVIQSRGPVPPFVVPPGTPTPAVVASAGRWPTLAPVATVSQPQRMHSCVTPRGFTGTTAYSTTTTPRPFTGTTEDPC